MTNKFSIKDLENLSGIKAHTIRIWEQRYNLLQPSRTDTNIRYYTNEDLKLILNVSLLNNHGVKISKIALLKSDAISHEVSKITKASLSDSEQMNQLILSLIELDEEKFDTITEQSIERIGFRDTVTQLIYPFLGKIGLMWQTDTINPAQEHFISCLIRQKFITSIDKQKHLVSLSGKRILLFLPEGELHEVSLLFYNYILRENGHRTYYLGQSVPVEDTLKVINQVNPDIIISVLTSFLKDCTPDEFAQKLVDRSATSKVILTGFQFQDSTLPSHDRLFIAKSGKEMVDTLNSL